MRIAMRIATSYFNIVPQSLKILANIFVRIHEASHVIFRRSSEQSYLLAGCDQGGGDGHRVESVQSDSESRVRAKILIPNHVDGARLALVAALRTSANAPLTSRIAIYTENLVFSPTPPPYPSIECLARSHAAAAWRSAILATGHERGKLSSQQRRHSLCLSNQAMEQKQKEKRLRVGGRKSEMNRGEKRRKIVQL